MNQLIMFLQRQRRGLLWAGGLLALYSLLGFLLVPWLAERQLGGLLQQRLAVRMQLETLRFNPFTFTLSAEQLNLHSATDDPLLALEHLYLNLDPAWLLLLRVRASDVVVDTLQLHYQRHSTSDDTLSRLADQWIATALVDEEVEPVEEESDGALFAVEIGNFQYREGSIVYRDEVPSTAFTTIVGPINIAISNFSTRDIEEKGIKNLVIQLEQGATLTWNSDFALTPLELSGHLELTDFSLTTPYRYFQDSLPFVLNGGSLSAGLDYRLSLGDSGPLLQLDNMEAQLRALNVADAASGTVLLAGGNLELEGGSFSYPEQQAQIAAVRIGGFNVALQRNRDGVVDWSAMLQRMTEFPPEPALQSSPVPAQAGTSVSPPTSALGLAPASAPVATTATPLQLNIAEIALDTTTVGFTDLTPQAPANVELQVQARLQNFTLADAAVLPLSMQLQVGSGGDITLQGELLLFPALEFDGTLEVASLALQALQPYLDDVAQIDIDGGALSLTARLHSGSGEALSWQGDVELAELLLTDRQREETLLSLARMQMDNLDFSLAERNLEISDLGIDGFYARVLIDENGATNIGSTLVSADAAATTPPDTAEVASETDTTEAVAPFKISLGRLRLSDASSEFTDFNLPIVFDTKMQQLDGELSGFSTQSSEPMSVRLEGQVGAFGLAEITGSLNPLDPTGQTRIQLAFSNLELPAMSPYVIKFAGREIAEGRVDVELEYVIDDSALEASNSVVIRDMRLGERVPYPDAVNLPLDLAVALLKNSAGVIDLQVPVTGNVDDPQFSFGPVIRQAIVNVLTNIVTAPFRLLGSLIGGGAEEIDNIRFRPGRSDLAPPEQEKLQKLLNALTQRPQLTLEIPAPYAADEDRLVLQQVAVDARIEAQLAADASSDQLLQRRQAALEQLYLMAGLSPTLEDLQLEFTSPTPEAGDDGVEQAPPAELDALAYSARLRESLVAAEIITQAQLQELARQRQATVADFLLASGELMTVRLQLQEATTVEIDSGWLSAKFALGALN